MKSLKCFWKSQQKRFWNSEESFLKNVNIKLSNLTSVLNKKMTEPIIRGHENCKVSCFLGREQNLAKRTFFAILQQFHSSYCSNHKKKFSLRHSSLDFSCPGLTNGDFLLVPILQWPWHVPTSKVIQFSRSSFQRLNGRISFAHYFPSTIHFLGNHKTLLGLNQLSANLNK